MSSAFCSYVQNLFSSEEKSDCLIVFCNRTSESVSTESDDCLANDCDIKSEVFKSGRSHRAPSFLAKALHWVHGYGKLGDAEPDVCIQSARSDASVIGAIGGPLPAHQIVICGGSQLFRDQVDEWVRKHGPASKPMLRVPLDGNQELPYALSALRFIYTGVLDVTGVAALLHVRHMATDMHVVGCVEACDTAVLAIINYNNSHPTYLEPLTGVVELYMCRHLLEDLSVDPDAVHSFQRACRQQLVKHSATFISQHGGGMEKGGSSVSLGELLAWAFGDAPSILSDPETQERMEALPAAALELLLSCEHFATDDESTVLLLLVRWLEVNIMSTDFACLSRLCSLVRVAQLSTTYLHSLLPAMSWFPISIEEHLFLCDYVHATDAKKTRAAKMATGMYDFSSPWYSSVPRPAPLYDTVRSYEWSIREDDLKALMAEEKEWVDCQFSNGASRVVAQGFDWFVGLVYCREGDIYTAITYLDCQLAPSLRPGSPGKPLAIIGPGPARVVVYKWREDGSREEASSFALKPGQLIDATIGGGESRLLPLGVPSFDSDCESAFGDVTGSEADDGLTANQLAPWAAYVRDGKLSGAIIFG